MKIRADVAELLRQGFNNAEISRATGADRKTVARARELLDIPNTRARRPASPLERIYAEALPTGRVRDWKPAVRMPISPARAAANYAELGAELAAIARERRARRTTTTDAA